MSTTVLEPREKATKTEAKTTTQPTNLSFAERMVEGLKTIQVPGNRTLYVGDGELKLEIKDGKLFNMGFLRAGWYVRTSGGTRGELVKVDEGKAIMKLGENLEYSISARSEVEIIDPTAKYESTTTDSPKAEGEVQSTVASNKQQYSFNGQTYTKGFLARAIVQQLVNDNPKLSIKELEDKFPAPFMGKFGLFKEVSEAEKISGNGQPRYYFKDEHLITVGDQKIAVCSQITTDKINAIIEIAKSLGYDAQEI